jgi:HlyD family secretion protein
VAEARLRRRHGVAILAVAGVLLFFLGGWTVRNKLAADRQGQWIPLTRGDLVSGVEVTGTLAAIESDSLGPPPLEDFWDFKLSMLAPEGSDVKKGQPVLAFDTIELQRRFDNNSAIAEQAKKEIEKTRADVALHREDDQLQLAEAEARLRKYSLKLDMPPDLLGMKERREAEIDHDVAVREVAAIRTRMKSVGVAAAAQIRLLESKRRQAELVVASTQSAIRAMTVLAPRDGTVVYITDFRGEKKKVGDSIWRALRVVEIPDLRRMKANGDVDESDAGRVAVGQRVTLRLDAHPDDEFQGTITRASRTVQQQAGTRNPVKVLRVEIALDKSDPAKMRPGMRFQGTVELARARNALLIPREAVFVSDDGPVAYRRGLFSVATVPLTLGRQNEKFFEVRSGLGPDDRVMVARSPEKEEPKS